MTDRVDNLDLQCARQAQEMTANGWKETETTIQESLGVLQEDGVFACFLYLLYLEKKKRKGVRDIVDYCTELLRNNLPSGSIGTGIIGIENVASILGALGNNLDQLFFAKEMLERTLIYARYYAKATQKGTGED